MKRTALGLAGALSAMALMGAASDPAERPPCASLTTERVKLGVFTAHKSVRTGRVEAHTLDPLPEGKA